MNADTMADVRRPIRENLGLALLLYAYIAISCASLVCIAFIYPEYHIFFHPAGLAGAIAVVAAFSVVTILFVFAEFSFGYCIGYYFYMMVAGYLWLNHFSEFGYNHRLSALSAAASAVGRSRPRSAAIAPCPTGTACCMARPRSCRSRAASDREKVPTAQRAEYSPRE